MSLTVFLGVLSTPCMLQRHTHLTPLTEVLLNIGEDMFEQRVSNQNKTTVFIGTNQQVRCICNAELHAVLPIYLKSQLESNDWMGNVILCIVLTI